MSVATPKSSTKEPIDLDVLLVCRKKIADRRKASAASAALVSAADAAALQVVRFNAFGRRLSRNDVRVILLSQLLVKICVGRSASEVEAELARLLPATRSRVETIWQEQKIASKRKQRPRNGVAQLSLFK